MHSDTPRTDGWGSLPEELRDDTFLQVIQELALVKNHHRPLVLVTHGFIEMMVEALIKHHVKNPKRILVDSRTYPHSAKLLILNEVGVVDDQTYRVFDWFRRLRNRAAHEPLFKLLPEDFQRLRCSDPPEPLKDFHRFCIFLLGGFWNVHLDVLGPLFAPGALGKSTEDPTR